MKVIDLENELERIVDPWSPRIAAELNGQHVKLARLEGEFIWHHHEAEDELFLVLRGDLELQFRDRSLRLGPGQMAVVPRGVEHRPVAHGEVEILLFEPATTLNTGNVENERTVADLDHI